MSRSSYDDQCDNWDLIRWRGAVNSAIKGHRGQQLLRAMLTALDAMPTKRLISHELELNGDVCALGCVGRAWGIDMSNLDPNDPEAVAKAFRIAPALVCEIAYINDDCGFYRQTPEYRWQTVRNWVAEKLL